jgi:hypothetical protein
MWSEEMLRVTGGGALIAPSGVRALSGGTYPDPQATTTAAQIAKIVR